MTNRGRENEIKKKQMAQRKRGKEGEEREGERDVNQRGEE
jgi:hypothetical protein